MSDDFKSRVCGSQGDQLPPEVMPQFRPLCYESDVCLGLQSHLDTDRFKMCLNRVR